MTKPRQAKRVKPVKAWALYDDVQRDLWGLPVWLFLSRQEALYGRRRIDMKLKPVRVTITVEPKPCLIEQARERVRFCEQYGMLTDKTYRFAKALVDMYVAADNMPDAVGCDLQGAARYQEEFDHLKNALATLME